MFTQKKIFFHTFFLVFMLYFSISPVQAALFDSPYKKIAKLIAQKANDKNKAKIAVLTFQSLDQENLTMGEMISEEIIVELVNNSSLNVVERSQVEKLLKELQFNQTGAIDAEAAKKIGNGLGADALVIGSYTSVGDTQIKLYTKLVDTETFQVLAASQEVIKKELTREDREVQEQSRSEKTQSSWSNFEVGILSGVNIPQGTISTNYTVDTTTAIISSKTVENNLSGISLSSSIPIALRTNIWYGPVFGTGFDIGYNTFRFSTQTINGTSKYSTGVLSTPQQVDQTVSITPDDYYQLHNFYISANFLIRIPISPRFYPYAGIGYKFSLQSITHNGSSTDIYDPLSGREVGVEFGISSSGGSLQGLLNLFTYMVGVQWYIVDNLGIQAEYQIMSYGDTQYLKTGFGQLTHTDPYWGDVSGDSGYTLNMSVSPFSVHILHLGVMFKFD